jgi:formyltetrahydrofolate-dependent phosphoribosylglycinamide formyltransferase
VSRRTAAPLPAAAFASGSGSNFQALLDRESRGASWRLRLLISDREDATALDRARAAGVEARVVPVRSRDPGEVGRETLDALREAGVGVVFLAGYLRLVSQAVVEAFRGRILNIHPALLPAFGGKGMWGRHVHEAVLAAGCPVSGATVHLVDERFDEGRVLGQWPVPVLAGDTAETLARRVLAVEHLLYPLVAEHVCRALAAGREPTPFAPAGDAYGLLDGGIATDLVHLSQEAFRSP